LSVIIKGIEEARRIFERMTSYVIYRIAMTTDIMFFIVLATTAYGFFPLTPIMIIALVLLDDLPIMTIAFDHAPVSPKPVSWNMPRILTISSVLGLLAVLQSFGLLYLGDTVWHLDPPHLQTMLFLQLVAGGHLMLFLARAPGSFLRPPYPAPRLFWAIIGTQVFAVFMSAFGWGVPSLPWNLIGWVWVYNLAWMIVQDLIKVCVYKELDQRAAGTTPLLPRLKTQLHPHGALHQAGPR